MEYELYDNIFNDDLYEMLDFDEHDAVANKTLPKFGDVIVYNYKSNTLDVLSKGRCGIENDKAIIGIVVSVNDDMTVDVLMKTFLTSSAIYIPYRYINNHTCIPAYLKDLFDRYCNKYKRESVIDIHSFIYKVPSIGFLDYVISHITELLDVISSIWGEERSKSFFERLYANGVFSIYKNKYYKWFPIMNKKRKILNLEALNKLEFLPMFTLQY